MPLRSPWGLVLVPYTGVPGPTVMIQRKRSLPHSCQRLVALSCVPRTCLHLLSVIDEQLRVSRVKFSYLLFNNASLFGQFHGCYLPRYLFVG